MKEQNLVKSQWEAVLRFQTQVEYKVKSLSSFCEETEKKSNTSKFKESKMLNVKAEKSQNLKTNSPQNPKETQFRDTQNNNSGRGLSPLKFNFPSSERKKTRNPDPRNRQVEDLTHEPAFNNIEQMNLYTSNNQPFTMPLSNPNVKSNDRPTFTIPFQKVSIDSESFNNWNNKKLTSEQMRSLLNSTSFSGGRMSSLGPLAHSSIRMSSGFSIKDIASIHSEKFFRGKHKTFTSIHSDKVLFPLSKGSFGSKDSKNSPKRMFREPKIKNRGSTAVKTNFEQYNTRSFKKMETIGVVNRHAKSKNSLDSDLECFFIPSNQRDSGKKKDYSFDRVVEVDEVNYANTPKLPDSKSFLFDFGHSSMDDKFSRRNTLNLSSIMILPNKKGTDKQRRSVFDHSAINNLTSRRNTVISKAAKMLGQKKFYSRQSKNLTEKFGSQDTGKHSQSKQEEVRRRLVNTVSIGNIKRMGTGDMTLDRNLTHLIYTQEDFELKQFPSSKHNTDSWKATAEGSQGCKVGDSLQRVEEFGFGKLEKIGRLKNELSPIKRRNLADETPQTNRVLKINSQPRRVDLNLVKHSKNIPMNKQQPVGYAKKGFVKPTRKHQSKTLSNIMSKIKKKKRDLNLKRLKISKKLKTFGLGFTGNLRSRTKISESHLLKNKSSNYSKNYLENEVKIVSSIIVEEKPDFIPNRKHLNSQPVNLTSFGEFQITIKAPEQTQRGDTHIDSHIREISQTLARQGKHRTTFYTPQRPIRKLKSSILEQKNRIKPIYSTPPLTRTRLTTCPEISNLQRFKLRSAQFKLSKEYFENKNILTKRSEIDQIQQDKSGIGLLNRLEPPQIRLKKVKTFEDCSPIQIDTPTFPKSKTVEMKGGQFRLRKYQKISETKSKAPFDRQFHVHSPKGSSTQDRMFKPELNTVNPNHTHKPQFWRQTESFKEKVQTRPKRRKKNLSMSHIKTVSNLNDKETQENRDFWNKTSIFSSPLISSVGPMYHQFPKKNSRTSSRPDPTSTRNSGSKLEPNSLRNSGSRLDAISKRNSGSGSGRRHSGDQGTIYENLKPIHNQSGPLHRTSSMGIQRFHSSRVKKEDEGKGKVSAQKIIKTSKSFQIKLGAQITTNQSKVSHLSKFNPYPPTYYLNQSNTQLKVQQQKIDHLTGFQPINSVIQTNIAKREIPYSKADPKTLKFKKSEYPYQKTGNNMTVTMKESSPIVSKVQTAKMNPNQTPNLKCKCKKSKCLKLYCQCFANQLVCGADCNCRNCCNRTDLNAIRIIIQTEMRLKNPQVFKQQFRKQNSTTKQNKSTLAHTSFVNAKGCKCSKNKCQQNYCQCFAAGIPCTTLCKCVHCSNQKANIKASEKLKIGFKPERRRRKINYLLKFLVTHFLKISDIQILKEINDSLEKQFPLDFGSETESNKKHVIGDEIKTRPLEFMTLEKILISLGILEEFRRYFRRESLKSNGITMN